MGPLFLYPQARGGGVPDLPPATAQTNAKIAATRGNRRHPEMGKHGEFRGSPFVDNLVNSCTIALTFVVVVSIAVGAGMANTEFLDDGSAERDGPR